MHQRKIQFNGQTLITKGVSASLWRDVYYRILVAPWPLLFVWLIMFYLSANLVFAVLYLLGGDCIANAKPGSWWDSFFFSVQTWATIGYGAMAPKTKYADILVSLEAFCGMMSMSVVTGLIFTKFARPRAKILFTDKALISKFDGKPVMMIRLGNIRGNLLVEAKVSIVYSSESVTKENQTFRKLVDLKLVRHTNVLFALTWQVMHEIDQDSPFYGKTQSDLEKEKFQLVVSVSGLDEEFNQSVHSRHLYTAKDLGWDQRFADVLSTENGVRVVDYSRFNQLVNLN